MVYIYIYIYIQAQWKQNCIGPALITAGAWYFYPSAYISTQKLYGVCGGMLHQEK